MSSGVNQPRIKEQVGTPGGTYKDGNEEFDAYIHSQQQYNSMGGDPYASSYYPATMTFPYVNQGISDGAWSSGGDPTTMAFLGSAYGDQQSQYMSSDAVFGQSSFSYNQPGFNFFPSGDYNTWGNTARPAARNNQGYREDYYTDYGMPNGMDRTVSNMRQIEQGMGGLNLREGASGRDSMRQGGGDVMKSMDSGSGGHISGPKKMTWATVASQPARAQPKIKPKSIPPAPILPGKSMDIGMWENKNSMTKMGGVQSRQSWGAPRGRGIPGAYSTVPTPQVIPGASIHQQPIMHQPPIQIEREPEPVYEIHEVRESRPRRTTPPLQNHNSDSPPSNPVVKKLLSSDDYNPKDFDTNPKNARFFIIKSYSEDDIHRSIKYGIWCSTEHGNRRLDAAMKERSGKGPIYLFFSVNGSGHFCGVAQMMTEVDYDTITGVWAQSKWKGQFQVKWIFVKDVPNQQLRHIRLENNENKPVTNSRDTQEVPPEKGKQVLKIIASYRHSTSIFDDFIHYEKRQEEENMKRDGGHRSDRGDRGGDKGNDRGRRH